MTGGYYSPVEMMGARILLSVFVESIERIFCESTGESLESETWMFPRVLERQFDDDPDRMNMTCMFGSIYYKLSYSVSPYQLKGTKLLSLYTTVGL
jgi:hypothetical protein